MHTATYSGPEGKEYPFLAGAVNPVPGESYLLVEVPNDGYWAVSGSKTPTVAELREQADALGLDTSGMKKPQLQAALAEAANTPTETDRPADPPSDPDAPAGDEHKES